jgi:hypothetical protein
MNPETALSIAILVVYSVSMWAFFSHLDSKQRERHHQDWLALEREKAGLTKCDT